VATRHCNLCINTPNQCDECTAMIHGTALFIPWILCRVRVRPIWLWLVRCSSFTMDSAVLGLGPFGRDWRGAHFQAGVFSTIVICDV
jgi:hypothetical protein